MGRLSSRSTEHCLPLDIKRKGVLSFPSHGVGRVRLVVGVCTWNMGNTRPYANTLPSMLPPPPEAGWGRLDVLALGVQEADFKASFPHASAAADWFKSVQAREPSTPLHRPPTHTSHL